MTGRRVRGGRRRLPVLCFAPPLPAGCCVTAALVVAGVVVVVVVVVVDASLYKSSFLKHNRQYFVFISARSVGKSTSQCRVPFEVFRRILAIDFGHEMAYKGFLIEGGIIGA